MIIQINKYFGEFCSDGKLATDFLKNEILPILDEDKIIFDFSNIRNMNSSFSNALFSNLIMQQGNTILKKISFINCNDNIKLLIRTSINMGVKAIDNKNK